MLDTIYHIRVRQRAADKRGPRAGGNAGRTREEARREAQREKEIPPFFFLKRPSRKENGRWSQMRKSDCPFFSFNEEAAVLGDGGFGWVTDGPS